LTRHQNDNQGDNPGASVRQEPGHGIPAVTEEVVKAIVDAVMEKLQGTQPKKRHTGLRRQQPEIFAEGHEERLQQLVSIGMHKER
jgi:hypothetical protein